MFGQATAETGIDGAITGYVGTITDISERKRAEEALRHSEERFRKAFDYAAMGIALVTPQGHWLRVNPALQAILGYSEAELRSLPYQHIVYPDDLEMYRTTLQKVLAGDISHAQIEHRCIHKLNHLIWVNSIISLVPNGERQAVCFVKHLQDITESRALQQVKNEFISIVSHELRTPLTSIRGALGMLTSGLFNDEPETTQHMLNVANHEAERLVRLVNDILDLERLESRKVTLNQQWCDAVTLVHQAVESLRPLAGHHQIHLTITTSSLSLWADPDRIVQVLINLIGNAIKFSPPEHTVTINTQAQPNDILFQVQDQGRGIPSDQLETIFQRFHQVDASDSRDRDGTGLGLTICRNIVQHHGGRIWVESIVGKGSIFYFTLPRLNHATISATT